MLSSPKGVSKQAHRRRRAFDTLLRSYSVRTVFSFFGAICGIPADYFAGMQSQQPAAEPVSELAYAKKAGIASHRNAPPEHFDPALNVVPGPCPVTPLSQVILIKLERPPFAQFNFLHPAFRLHGGKNSAVGS